MAKLYPYLAFDNAKEALGYYEEVFGATNITRLPVGEEQSEMFGIPKDDLENTTVHGGFTVLGANLFCSDSFGKPVSATNQISIMLDLDNEDPVAVAEAEAFYEKVSSSGKVTITLPYAEQFWGGKMGQFVDEYGISWMLHSQPYSKL
ncbi:VOC family protein [Listeria seeligeri]|uniref:VOC family protein n=1 Tax=Listeria seeligeri TaxID=1640 RepID=UPI0010D34AA1|nr:glyoxalase/bleomycin resistance/extradiol dioxygenase family protein [Listeria seeligeri]MBC1420357.1 glyoxalase/bleomycin resistance/extradiol dioxygenase family protein [Listeria seeligeri]MBC1423416.1 glyoxalase/bleomycin resistance/extradiol dioxygenase family protein [Listeria seeligeri]MBC1429471.1 glyoxalase/bleomycin resistance/extradiol dioxygenase family protein [Listeria seeligeri]MBC1442607.1 glyoxalase/bleomycin resistance/extradiol dioxygenase family protein [Listeria seeligeri